MRQSLLLCWTPLGNPVYLMNNGNNLKPGHQQQPVDFVMLATVITCPQRWDE
jgi:hypothetical protein